MRTRTIKWPAVLTTGLLGAVCGSNAPAVPISYSATADTSAIQPFSVTDMTGSAAGLWNETLQAATIDIAFNNGHTPF
jgi:hypothetical protein